MFYGSGLFKRLNNEAFDFNSFDYSDSFNY